MPPPGPQFQPLGDWFAMKLRWLGAGLGLLILGAVTTYAQQTPPQPHPAASPQQQPAPKPANIDRNGVLMLIRSTLLALDQANKTGNYTVLRDLGAPGFQANTAARLAEIFAKQRAAKTKRTFKIAALSATR